MCRLLGVIASEPTEFRIVLREVPRSLAALSEQHPDGWGLAIFEQRTALKDAYWSIRKGTACAQNDDEFHRHAVGSRGEVLISHIRQKTVGSTCLTNTHPFESDGWVFAHNGTITDLAYVRSRASATRAAAVRGETDSELFFAWVMTELDSAGFLGAGHHGDALDEVVKRIVSDARSRPDFGAFNFLLSNGEVTYAHRFGRALHFLRRGPHDQVRRQRTTDDGVTLFTPWSQRRQAVFVASERMTDEPWEELPEGTLLRIDRGVVPVVRAL